MSRSALLELGRQGDTSAARVSRALRGGSAPELRRRRAATALTLLATASLGVVHAYQTGLIPRVPEPRWRFLDADRVDASPEAYQWLHTPDAGLGIASYGITLALLGAGAADRAERAPWLPAVTAAKVAADALGATYLFAEQVSRHRAVCSWCTVAAGASLLSLPLVLPEAWKALGRRQARS